MPDGAVVAFDIGILLRSSGLDVVQDDSFWLRPFYELGAGIFRAVVYPNGVWLAPQAADHVFSR